MKRFVGALLGICIIMGLLTGCGKSNWQRYKDALASLNKNDLKFTLELAVEGENEIVSGIVDADSIKLIVDGNVSADNEMAEMSFSLNIPSAQTTVELTDVIIDGTKMYMNGQKLFTIISDSVGTEDTADMLMDGNSYILMDMDADLNINEPQIRENDGLLTLIKNMSGIYETAITDQDAVSKDGNTYTLSLDGSAIQDLTLKVVTDVQDNKETYYDTISDLVTQMYSNDILELIGSTIEDLENSRDEILTQLDDILAELRDSIETADFSNTSYTSKVDDKSTELDLTFIMGNEINLKYSYSAEKTDMNSVQTPEDYILWSEFEDVINSLDINSDNQAEAGDSGGDAAVDNEPFSFNATGGDSNPQILDADLSGYTFLTNYSLESDITGEKYIVPIIDSELYESTGSIYSTSESSGVSTSYYCWDMYNEEFLAYCEEYFRDTYEFYGEYGIEAYYSDAYVSADGNTVIMAMAYDMGYETVLTEVYVFQYINEEEMLYGLVGIDNNNLDETDNAILSEYSQLLGVDLTGYLNLFDKANASIV